MKLRIRSMATKETLRVDAPDSSSLRDLKTLIAGKLSSSSSSSSSSPPIDPESIHLSLNRKDELLAPSAPAADSLPSLSLTSGDLLFYSLSPFSQTLAPPNPPTPDSFGRVQTLGSKPVDRMEVDADGIAGTLDSKPEGRMEVDPEPSVVVKKPSLVPRILKRVMDLEKGENEGILGRLVITIHAAFLDSGFLVARGGDDGSRLPPNWASDASTLSVQYTLRDLVGRLEEKDAKFSIVRFSVMGNFVTVYGYLSGEHPSVYRVCIDASKIAPFLSLAMDSMSERDEKELLKLWNTVKDGLCLPLLIDICSKNGLPLPPCFLRLSRDLKTDILELASGVDLARIACICSEMSAICSDDKLWKKKFEKEFGSSSAGGAQGMRWRERFAAAWIEKKNASKMSNRRVIRSGVLTDRRFNPARPIFPVRPYRYPIVGGDYDLYPAIGNLSPQGAGLRNSRNPARREFSPHCNFGGYSRGGFGGFG